MSPLTSWPKIAHAMPARQPSKRREDTTTTQTLGAGRQIIPRILKVVLCKGARVLVHGPYIQYIRNIVQEHEAIHLSHRLGNPTGLPQRALLFSTLSITVLPLCSLCWPSFAFSFACGAFSFVFSALSFIFRVRCMQDCFFTGLCLFDFFSSNRSSPSLYSPFSSCAEIVSS